MKASEQGLPSLSLLTLSQDLHVSEQLKSKLGEFNDIYNFMQKCKSNNPPMWKCLHVSLQRQRNILLVILCSNQSPGMFSILL